MDYEYCAWTSFCYRESLKIINVIFDKVDDDVDNVDVNDKLTDYTDHMKSVQIEIFKDLLGRYNKKIKNE